MAQDWTIRGVPMVLQRDSWWLDDDGTAQSPTRTAPGRRPLAALVLLVLLADILFYRHSVGVSLALFAATVFAAGLGKRPSLAALTILTLSVLPVIDYVQPLSVTILTLGLLTSITLTRLPARTTLLAATLTLTRQIPLRAAQDLITSLHKARIDLNPSGAVRTIAKAWAFPVGGTLILVSLLAEANPVMADWLATLANLPIDPIEWATRLSFWLGMALLIWPLLVIQPAAATANPKRALTLPNMGLNAASVTNALITFNAILALQTVLDARYLWSGALPPGMTAAEYAHRGAYPLLATALLAGAFALAARPWLHERKLLKPLLILWLAQNILLTLSALYRLDLYVGAFGLTYLRVYAFIWMALVAAGLALTLTQIAAAKPNLWLLSRSAVLGAATLYLCAFVNFADLIAQVNVTTGKIDPLYLCELGPTAAASVPNWAWKVEDSFGYDSNLHYCTLTAPAPHGWRDWGFRNWRVLRNLHLTGGAP